jgi:solute carrier family 25 thiamine pyrophosphate transporter 19
MGKFDTFIAGGGAGLAATVATYPFDVIRTQFAAQGLPRAHETMWSFVQATVKGSQGVRGLFAGLMPTAIQIIPRMGLSFALYEKLEERNHHSNHQKKQDKKTEEANETENEHENNLAEAYRWWLSAFYGGLSGGIARVVVHPLDTLKRRMQAQVFVSAHTEVYGEQSTRTFPNSWVCLRHIVREEGVLALYKGLSPTLLKSVLSTAIIFSVYEGLKARLLLAAPHPARTQ